MSDLRPNPHQPLPLDRIEDHPIAVQAGLQHLGQPRAEPTPQGRTGRWAVWVLRCLAGAGVLIHGVVAVLNLAGGSDDPDKRAVVGMGLGLISIWCVLGGLAMRLGRDRFVAGAKRVKVNWRVKFVCLCILLALLEEAVTTALTNAAPLLGAVSPEARITSSAHYLQVVLGRVVNGEYQAGSVVAFVPWMLCWAWLLGRWDFRPAEVMLLFGLTGTLAETVTFGPQNLVGAAMWVYVYGLMVYLPAWTVPQDRPTRPPRWYHWPLAACLPRVFVIPLAAYLVWAAIRQGIRLCVPKTPAGVCR